LPEDDEITSKLAMLFEGQCEGFGPTAAARKFGYSKQRYFQLLEQFEAEGALALLSKVRGPKTNYRRTEELVRQIIRHRFLDPEASAEVIAQKLQQAHHLISIRSVERVISDFGLQKKNFTPLTLKLHPNRSILSALSVSGELKLATQLVSNVKYGSG
jgi:transposase